RGLLRSAAWCSGTSCGSASWPVEGAGVRCEFSASCQSDGAAAEIVTRRGEPRFFSSCKYATFPDPLAYKIHASEENAHGVKAGAWSARRHERRHCT